MTSRPRVERIRLGDIDGSGTADLLYFGSEGARVWINASGNRYGDAVAIDGLPAFDGAAAVELADLLSTGCAAVVWSSNSASLRGTHVKYVDLAPGGKPYLLRAIDNGMGLRRTLEHDTSTRAYLQDRAAGQPWLTRVPFVVHTLSRVVVTEAITQRRFATRYRYRHGHYDGAEREFRSRMSAWCATARSASNGSTPSRPPGCGRFTSAGGFERFWNQSFDRLDAYVRGLAKANPGS